MRFSEWSKFNIKELKYILKQNKIKNYSNMNKAELQKNKRNTQTKRWGT